MARSSTFPQLSIHMTLLLMSVLFISTPLYIYQPAYYLTGYPLIESSAHNETLTEESPILRLNTTSEGSIVIISSLRSNDTPVTLRVRGATHIQFRATNVTSLEGYDIEVNRVESDLWVEVLRQESDATVSITIYYQGRQIIYYPPAAPPPAFNLVPAFGLLLLVYAFLQLVFVATRSKPFLRVKVGLVIAIILVLFGTSCCYPMIRGQVQHDFDLMNTLVTSPDEDFSFLLNETHPSSCLNLSSLFSEDGRVVKYKVHTIISSNYPVMSSISNDGGFACVLENESQNSDWWVSFPVTSNRSVMLKFDRVDSDAEVTLRVRMTYLTLLPRADITIPAVLCAIGIVAMTFGLGLTVMVDRYSPSGKYQENHT